MEELSNEYEKERREKLAKLRALGIDPFGSRSDGLLSLESARKLFVPEAPPESAASCKTAGRIVLKRDMGKLSFLTLSDESGKLQVALDRKRLDDLAWGIRDLLDLGDQIVVEGTLGLTRTGEITLWATSLKMGAKAMLPPPSKWEGLSDVEQRYRQRYVDLFANPDSMRLAHQRIRIIEEVRKCFRAKGFVEVETPMMQPLAGGAAAKPFITHHNALDMRLFMRIAPELYLKRLLVGGFQRVFELNRNFRNEGISPRHNPEFTMVEAYQAHGNYATMADFVEETICTVAQNVMGTLKIEHKRGDEVIKTINLARPWRRVKLVDLVAERTGWRFDGRKVQDAAPQVVEMLFSHGARKTILDFSPHEQLVETYEKLIESTLIDPCFVTHLPSVMIPLAKESPEDPAFAEVYELAINGQEISPGYTELNDPDVQARHFRHQVGEDQHNFDEDFITALKYGMPPAGGMGMGIDRLVMMLTGAESIRDIILFPLMRPGVAAGEPSKPPQGA